MQPLLLLTDPDPILTVVLQRCLLRRGFDVQTASAGVDCLQKLRYFEPQVLVLSDELLWGGSAGVLAFLREEADLPPLPVVLISADDRSPECLALMGPPVVQCLLKPFSLPMLLCSIRWAIDGGAALVSAGGAGL